MRLAIAILSISTTFAATADWHEAASKLAPGERIEVHHMGRIDRGLYALANAYEIVITTTGNGFVSIRQAEVDRVIKRGAESPKLGYFANADDQLFPTPVVIYERAGAPPVSKSDKKRHWWSRR